MPSSHLRNFILSLVEIEGVLNSRPLIYDFDEINEPLTPSQLSIGRRILPTSTHTAQRPLHADLAALTRRAKFLQQTLKIMQGQATDSWERWTCQKCCSHIQVQLWC